MKKIYSIIFVCMLLTMSILSIIPSNADAAVPTGYHLPTAGEGYTMVGTVDYSDYVEFPSQSNRGFITVDWTQEFTLDVIMSVSDWSVSNIGSHKMSLTGQGDQLEFGGTTYYEGDLVLRTLYPNHQAGRMEFGNSSHAWVVYEPDYSTYYIDLSLVTDNAQIRFHYENGNKLELYEYPSNSLLIRTENVGYILPTSSGYILGFYNYETSNPFNIYGIKYLRKPYIKLDTTSYSFIDSLEIPFNINSADYPDTFTLQHDVSLTSGNADATANFEFSKTSFEISTADTHEPIVGYLNTTGLVGADTVDITIYLYDSDGKLVDSLRMLKDENTFKETTEPEEEESDDYYLVLLFIVILLILYLIAVIIMSISHKKGRKTWGNIKRK